MPYELFIGMRYLRAKRKHTFISINTVISIAGIFLGVAALIIVLAVMNGFETELRDKILGINSHIIVMKYSGSMEQDPAIPQEIAGIKGIRASTPFIYGQGMVKNRDRVTGTVIRGIEPQTAFDVINLGKLKEGSIELLAPKVERQDLPSLPGILIGKELALNVGLALFDTAELLLPTGIPTPMGVVPKIKKFLVVGIFDSGFYEYDSTLVFMSLKDSQKFLNMEGLVTGIEVKVDDVYQVDTIAAAIEHKLGYTYWVRTWIQMNKNLFAALKLEKRVMFIILSLIVFVAAFNIITTLIMIVMEKTKDIAILKSMGATAGGIMKIFIIQGVVIGFIGTIFGSLAGLLIALNLEKVATSIEDFFGFKILPQDVYYLTELPSRVNYQDVAVIVVFSILICFLATIYPSWRASRLDPAEALRYE